jgi:phosphoribosylformimino-5-aminoimidazole carboxamide ribotide isomerase
MRIIPVLDILNSQVVHGIKGERNKYEPIRSLITTSCTPADVAKAFKTQFNISELYIADLDAIISQKFTFTYLREIIQHTNLQIMLDAGIDENAFVSNLLEKGVNKVIIGTETLRSLANLREILAITSPKNLIISLDLKYGAILTKAEDLRKITPLEAIHHFEELGIQETIILELTKVGSESGVMTGALQNILQNSSIQIITGGGARNIQDLKILKEAGVAGVLIATALHNGSITQHDLASL